MCGFDLGSTAAIALKESQESQTNQFIADEVAGLIKSRFDATLADKLMDERVREPEWLVDMMQNPTVRYCTLVLLFICTYMHCV